MVRQFPLDFQQIKKKRGTKPRIQIPVWHKANMGSYFRERKASTNNNANIMIFYDFTEYEREKRNIT